MRNPRVALMTGRSAVAARMTRSSSPLPREEGPSPELLRGKGGYSSGVCGRSFHLDGSGRNAEAVDRVLGWHNLHTFHDRLDYVKVSRGEGAAGKVTDFLDKRPASRPFFIWGNFNCPHFP